MSKRALEITLLVRLNRNNQEALFADGYEWYCDGAVVQHLAFTNGVLIVNTRDKKFSFSSGEDVSGCETLLIHDSYPIDSSIETVVMQAYITGLKDYKNDNFCMLTPEGINRRVKQIVADFNKQSNN